MSKKKVISEAPPGLVGSALGGLGRLAAKGVKKAYGAHKERRANDPKNISKKADSVAKDMSRYMAREWLRYSKEQDLEPTDENLVQYARNKWGVTIDFGNEIRKTTPPGPNNGPSKSQPWGPAKHASTSVPSAGSKGGAAASGNAAATATPASGAAVPTAGKAATPATGATAPAAGTQQAATQQAGQKSGNPPSEAFLDLVGHAFGQAGKARGEEINRAKQQKLGAQQPQQAPRIGNDRINGAVKGVTKAAGAGAKRSPPAPRTPARKPHAALDARYGMTQKGKQQRRESVGNMFGGSTTIAEASKNYNRSFSDIIRELEGAATRRRVMEAATAANEQEMGLFFDLLGRKLLQRSDVNAASQEARPGSKEWKEYLQYLQQNGKGDSGARAGQAQAQAPEQDPGMAGRSGPMNINWNVMSAAMAKAQVDKAELEHFVDTARKGDMNTLLQDIKKNASTEEAKRVMASILFAYAKAYPK